MLPRPLFGGLLNLLFVIALLQPESARAQSIRVQDGATVYRIFEHGDPGGMGVDFSTNGVDRLVRAGWWYRSGGNDAEKQFPAPDSQTVDGESATLIWNDVNGDGFKASLRITVIAGAIADAGTVQHEMTLEKTTSGTFGVTLFYYNDIDIQTAPGDTATAVEPSDEQTHIEIVNGSDTVYFHAFSYENYQVELFSSLRDRLNDDAETNFGDTGLPFGPGDFTGAYQWEFELEQDKPVVAFTTLSANTLPELPVEITLNATASECIPDPLASDPECRDLCGSATPLLVTPGQGTGAVAGGNNVRICYEVSNTGYKPLRRQDLVDDELGTLLSDFPFTLTPGSRFFITEKVLISEDREFTGTWTSYNPGPLDTVTSMDTVQVLIDTDGDGTADASDLCPADSEKVAIGQCGCGIADTDSDGDGIADCKEVCLNDPGKTDAGVCGCGVADTDSDGDGTPDCNDQCPDDQGKTETGVCGCGTSDADANGNGVVECGRELGTVNQEGLCVPGASDCVHQQLASSACVGVNGFLNQVNIASVINLLPANLNVLVEYFDLAGELKGSVRNTIAANLKFDYIINDLGLLPDTVGTVCVTSNGAEGAWTGGVAIYKPDERITAASQQLFGDGFDFALYYPFENLRTGSSTVPLNTFHLGTNPVATVANWIAISDGLRDGVALSGSVFYYNDQGQEIARDAVNVPDGGRRDFAGHTGLTGFSNGDAIGMAVFVPNPLPNGKPAPYLLTLTRYFYDCPGSSCNNFLTAFNIPNRPGTDQPIIGGVSTVNAEISVVELNNNTRTLSNTDVDVYAVGGQSLGSAGIEVPGRGTRHVIVNRVGTMGFLAENNSGSAAVEARNGYVSALSIFYKLDVFGGLQYAYAVPLVGSPGQLQISQFNSFIGHQNTAEFYNSGDTTATVDINYIDVAGNNVYGNTLAIPSRGTIRIDSVPLPANTFGTINVQSDKIGIVFRNYVSRPGQYTLSFSAQ